MHHLRLKIALSLIAVCVLAAAGTVRAWTPAYNPTFQLSNSGWRTTIIPAAGVPVINDSNNTPRNASPSPHNGVDLSLLTGTDVRAIYGGTATAFNDGSAGCGLWVRITHSSGLSSKYCHLSTTDIPIGGTRSVLAGDVIGKSGDTGNSGGPHLHFVVNTQAGGYYLADNMWEHYKLLTSGEWNSGYDIEFFKNYFATNGVFVIYAYAIDDQTTPRYPYYPTEMWVFHKKPTEASWRKSAMTRDSLDPKRWTYGFHVDPNYRSGDTIQVIVMGKSSVPNLVDGYPWAFHPAYYDKPTDDVNLWPSVNQYFTLVRP